MRRTFAVYTGGFESNLGLEASYSARWMRVRLSGFVVHPLIPSSEVGGIYTGAAQKVLKPVIYFSQNQQLAAAALRNKTFSCTCTGGCLNGMVW
jgi:hypothetical protein